MQQQDPVRVFAQHRGHYEIVTTSGERRLVTVAVEGADVTGRVREVDDDGVLLEVDGAPRRLPWEGLAAGRVQIEFRRPDDDLRGQHVLDAARLAGIAVPHSRNAIAAPAIHPAIRRGAEVTVERRLRDSCLICWFEGPIGVDPFNVCPVSVRPWTDTAMTAP